MNRRMERVVNFKVVANKKRRLEKKGKVQKSGLTPTFATERTEIPRKKSLSSLYALWLSPWN